jgi:hypothetical protein
MTLAVPASTVGPGRRRWAIAALAALLVGCEPAAWGTTSPTAAGSASLPAVPASPSAKPASEPPESVAPATARPIALLPALSNGPLDTATVANLQAVIDGLVAGGAPDAIASVVTAWIFDVATLRFYEVDLPTFRIGEPTVRLEDGRLLQVRSRLEASLLDPSYLP